MMMKLVMFLLSLFSVTDICCAQQKITFKTMEYILSASLKNNDIDSVMKTLGFKLHNSEQWSAQINLHYDNGRAKTDGEYAVFDISIMLSDNNKFYVAYRCRNADDMKNILKKITADSNYKANNVYLSHFSQPDDFLGKEYKNGIYDISTMSFNNNGVIDYSIAVGLESEYQKTRVFLSPNKADTIITR